jgi:hypothetical protein
VLDLLIAATDALKQGRSQLGRSADPALIEALHRTAASAGGVVAAPRVEAGPWRRLAPDRDLVAALAELFEELLPGLVSDPADAELASEDFATLARACAKLGLSGLGAAVDRLAAEPGRPALADLLDRLDTLERLSGCPTGAEAVRKAAGLTSPLPQSEPPAAAPDPAHLRLLESLGVDARWAAVIAAGEIDAGRGRAVWEVTVLWPDERSQRAEALGAISDQVQVLAGKPARVAGQPGAFLLVAAAGLRTRPRCGCRCRCWTGCSAGWGSSSRSDRG